MQRAALRDALGDLWHDREIALAVVRLHGLLLEDAPADFRNDREFVRTAVRQYGLALQYASEDIKNDRGVVQDAIQECGEAIEFASEDLRNDREIVMAAVQQGGDALECVPEDFRNDREIVMVAVRDTGFAIQWASEDLANDREIILEAMKAEGDALQCLPEHLTNDKQIVLAAVQQIGLALEYASEDLANDPEIVATALTAPWPSYAHRSRLEFGSKLKRQIMDILHALRDRGLDVPDELAQFTDTPTILDYVRQWKKELCERIWLVVVQIPAAVRDHSEPLAEDVKRHILDLAGVQKEYQSACDLVYCAPVILADTQSDNPRIGDLFHENRAQDRQIRTEEDV